jgi:hypothetical protein
MYTSGWPKNQKICWNRMGSPPPPGVKNVVLNWRSVSSIVMPPASTGNDRRRRNDVIRTDHKNSGIRKRVIPLGRILRIVTIMLIEPKIDEAPAKCILRIATSTEGPACPLMPLNGG